MNPQLSRTINASIIIPAFNERENISKVLKQFNSITSVKLEILVVVDSEGDNTKESVDALIEPAHLVKCLVQDVSPGPAGALKFGIASAVGEYIIVMMADGSDDVQDVVKMIEFLQLGAAIVCASRYMKGGKQIGGGVVKSSLSKFAGQLLFSFAKCGTHDATNSFKGYSRGFIKSVEIESTKGFELGIELVSKATRRREKVVEFPTTWVDRDFGSSNFKLVEWFGAYLQWFLYAFGPRISPNKPLRK